MSSQKRLSIATLVAFALLLPLLALLLVGPARSSYAAPTAANDWQVGNTVGLSKGTQIWEAPDIVNSCYHTIVPENDWAVKVTGFRSTSDNRTWYDTSRAAIDNTPGSGTGWVNIEQADSLSPVFDEGRRCSSDSTAPTATATITKCPDDVCCKLAIKSPEFLNSTKSWWEGEPIAIKLGVLILAFALLFSSPRWGGGGNSLFMSFIRAVLMGVLLAGVVDLTRPSWLPFWSTLSIGTCGIDPALLLLVVPVLFVAAGLLFSVASRLVSIVVLVLVVLFLLGLLLPGRLDGLLHIFGGTGGG